MSEFKIFLRYIFAQPIEEIKSLGNSFKFLRNLFSVLGILFLVLRTFKIDVILTKPLVILICLIVSLIFHFLQEWRIGYFRYWYRQRKGIPTKGEIKRIKNHFQEGDLNGERK